MGVSRRDARKPAGLRNDEGKRRSASVTDPMFRWTVLLHDGFASAGLALELSKLSGGQTLQIIIPPVEPAPKKR